MSDLKFDDNDFKRFWNKVVKTNKCWNWTGAKGQWGHGQFWNGKRLVNAHRISYEMHIGKIPKGLTIDHMCRNPPCVNPKHLQAITMRDNILLGSKAQNTHCPNGHPFSADNTFYIKTSRSCRICKRKRDIQYWKKHGECYRQRKRLQYLRDKDKILSKQRDYYHKNKEKILARQMAYQRSRKSAGKL